MIHQLFTNRVFQDNRNRYWVRPLRIVAADNGGGSIVSSSALLKDGLEECVITPCASAPPSLMLDFGQELNGGVELHFSDATPIPQARVRIRFGESVSEAAGTPCNDHAVHDVTLNLSVMAKHEFGSTGFRFVRLDFLDCQTPIRLRSVNAVALERNYEYKGRFECSDARLNRIWQTGARTVHLCCQDYLYDGIKRDRLVWMGDIHPEAMVIAAVFGPQAIVPDSVEKVYAETPAGCWINGHSSYSIWCLLTIWDWYLYTGDKAFLTRCGGMTRAIAEQLLSKIDADGQERLDGCRFLDWVSNDTPEAIDVGLHAMVVMGLTCALRILRALGQDDRCQTIKRVCERVKSRAVQEVHNKQANALLALAGIKDAGWVNRSCLSDNPCGGLSTWYGYYVLQARAMAGDYAGCLDLIRTYWGGMLDLGATTFWEHFDTAWLHNAGRIDEPVKPGQVDVHRERGGYCFQGLRHSLCHGWAGGPTAWLSEHILGVRPLEPGFRKARVRPNLCGLEYVHGVFPTPHGLIEVHCCTDKNGRLQADINAPKAIEIIR